MNLKLNNRVALVTGGSRGIGAGIVRYLANEGVKVAFCARASTALEELEAEVRSRGGDCIGMPLDVLDPEALTAIVDAAAAHWGGLDVVVNNVGGPIKFGGFEELSDDDWIKAYELNVMSQVRFTRAALPYLRKSTLKRIINISSTSAQQPGHYNPHYSATKAAVVNISKHLANVLAKEQILVNTVCPGPVHSDSWDTNITRTAVVRNVSASQARDLVEIEESAKIPLGKIGEAEQVAAMVAILASPISEWTTGSCFHINGGKIASAF